MKLLRYKLGFVPIFYFPIPRAGSSLLVPSFSIILQYDSFLKIDVRRVGKYIQQNNAGLVCALIIKK